MHVTTRRWHTASHRSSKKKELPNQGFFPTANWGFDASGQRAGRAAWVNSRLLLREAGSFTCPWCFFINSRPSTGIFARVALFAANIFHATERLSRVGLIGDLVWRFGNRHDDK